METIQEIFGWTGMCLTIISFLTPIPIYIKVIKGEMNFEEAPGVMIIICYINSFCWFIYGVLTFNYQLKFAYKTGWIICIIFMIIYLFYEIKKYFVDSIFNIIILITGTWTLYYVLVFIIGNINIIGLICIITSCIMFFFPIQIILNVIYEKNYLIISIYNSCNRFIYSICWIIFGSLIKEYNLIIPNVIAMVLSLLQIIIYFNYKRRYIIINEADFTIGIENNSNEDTNQQESNIKSEEPEIKGKAKPVKIKSEI